MGEEIDDWQYFTRNTAYREVCNSFAESMDGKKRRSGVILITFGAVLIFNTVLLWRACVETGTDWGGLFMAPSVFGRGSKPWVSVSWLVGVQLLAASTGWVAALLIYRVRQFQSDRRFVTRMMIVHDLMRNNPAFNEDEQRNFFVLLNLFEDKPEPH